MTKATTAQVQKLISPIHGEVEFLVAFENIVFLGTVSLVPLGMVGMMGICQDSSTGKKFAFPIPFGVGLLTEAA